jgi:hypothetical protein
MEVSGQIYPPSTLPLVTYWVGDWVGLRAGPDILEWTEILHKNAKKLVKKIKMIVFW